MLCEISDSKTDFTLAVVTAEPKLLIINQNISPNERISLQRQEAANRRFLPSQRIPRMEMKYLAHFVGN